MTILGAPIALRKPSGDVPKTTQVDNTSETVTGRGSAKVLGKGTLRDPDSASPDQREIKRGTVVQTLPKSDNKSIPPATSMSTSDAKRRKIGKDEVILKAVCEKEEMIQRSNSERKETTSRHNSEKRDIPSQTVKGQGDRRNAPPPISTQVNRYPSPATTPALVSRPSSAIPATATPLPLPVSSGHIDGVFTYPSGLPMSFYIVPDKQGLSFAMEVLIVSFLLLLEEVEADL